MNEYLKAALQECMGRGMALPFTGVAVDVHGSLLGVRTDGENPKVLAERYVRGVFALPINIMVVDAKGEAARLLIEKGGRMTTG
jgi:hypothetical protein